MPARIRGFEDAGLLRAFRQLRPGSADGVVRRLLRSIRLTVPLCLILISGSFMAATLLSMRMDRLHALSGSRTFQRKGPRRRSCRRGRRQPGPFGAAGRLLCRQSRQRRFITMQACTTSRCSTATAPCWPCCTARRSRAAARFSPAGMRSSPRRQTEQAVLQSERKNRYMPSPSTPPPWRPFPAQRAGFDCTRRANPRRAVPPAP